MDLQMVMNGTKNILKDKLGRVILGPLNELVDENITDITTTIGSFIISNIRGKFQRSISFTVGTKYSDAWMEEALYGILYQYNKIKQSSRLEMANSGRTKDGSGLYYRLDVGKHQLKYRNYDILLYIQSVTPTAVTGRAVPQRLYTIITYNLDPAFVINFERDMVLYRNSLLKIKANSPTVNVYQDLHEGDGYTYWEKGPSINKRSIETIYLPIETKKKIVSTINEFFASKEYYKKHGIAHNLKILLYGPAGPQPHSIEIPTPIGMMKFGDIKVGDKVFGLNGLPTKVTNINEQGELDVYEVTFNDGRKTLTAPTHKWPTVTSRGGFVEKTTLEMLESGLLDNDGNHKFKIPRNKEVHFKYKDVPIDPWVLGVFIGNGSMRQDKKLTLSAPNAIIPRIVANRLNLDIKKRSEDPKDYNWCFYNKDGSPVSPKEFFKDIPELVSKYSFEKSIPDDYIFNSREVRYQIIQGLMDTDGSITETNPTVGDYRRFNLSYSSTSEKLLTQIRFILNSLGFSSTINPDSRTEKYTNDYCASLNIQCSDRDKYLFFQKSPKIDRAYRALYQKKNTRSESGPCIFITEIKNLGYKESMRCITVADPLHIYQTSDFIPTCNSGKDSIAKMIASEWNRNIYYVTGGKGGKFIPNAITSDDDDVTYPLFIISDIDKYASLINDTEVDLNDDKAKEERMANKMQFGNMINALDGIMSGEDRIIVMTTNHIEKFSPVFTRPGRVDLMLEIGYVTPDVFRKYIYNFYGKTLPKNIKLKTDKLSIADLQFDVVYTKLPVDQIVSKYVK